MKTRAGAALAALERLACRPLGAVVLFAVALVVYAVEAIAWPLYAGRDLDEYLIAYVQLFDADALLPWSMLFRTPLTPVVTGVTLETFGGAFAELIVGVLYAGAVVAWAAGGRAFGPRVAIAMCLALLAYPGFALMFHELSSETVFAFVFSLWGLFLVRAATQPSSTRFAVLGLSTASLAYARPGNAVILLVAALLPLALAAPWRSRVTWLTATLVAAILPLLAWAGHNQLRFDEFVLARGGNAIIPFYRAFITDGIVSPENGPASRRLAAAVRTSLVTREPYRSYGVTAEQVFSGGSFRIHEDLYLLSDQEFGWDSGYSVLREAGLEAVERHPGTYTRGVLDTIWKQLRDPYYRGAGARRSTHPPTRGSSEGGGRQRLPTPTDGEPIPAGQVVWISRPDNAIRQVWTSPTEWHLEFTNPDFERRLEHIERDVRDLAGNFPDRDGWPWLAIRLNQVSHWFPPLALWLAVGLVAVAARRPNGSIALIAVTLAAMTVVALNAAGLIADPRFVLPLAPAFILLAVAGLLGRRSNHLPRSAGPA